MYGGTDEGHRTQHIQGLRALKVTGGSFAFDVPAVEVKIEAKRPDGALDTARVRVASIVPFLVMKAAALGRGKAKDTYGIYFCIKHFAGGVEALAGEFTAFKTHELVLQRV